jgi:predicted HTH transcriptional regulator
MPNSKRALPSARSRSNQTVKPVPPDDLWDRLRDDLSEFSEDFAIRPPGAFTMREFTERFNLTDGAARRKLQKLQRAKRIERRGSTGRNVYYVHL